MLEIVWKKVSPVTFNARVIPENVALMLGLPSHWGGRRPIVHDSRKTFEFSAQKNVCRQTVGYLGRAGCQEHEALTEFIAL